MIQDSAIPIQISTSKIFIHFHNVQACTRTQFRLKADQSLQI